MDQTEYLLDAIRMYNSRMNNELLAMIKENPSQAASPPEVHEVPTQLKTWYESTMIELRKVRDEAR